MSIPNPSGSDLHLQCAFSSAPYTSFYHFCYNSLLLPAPASHPEWWCGCLIFILTKLPLFNTSCSSSSGSCWMFGVWLPGAGLSTQTSAPQGQGYIQWSLVAIKMPPFPGHLSMWLPLYCLLGPWRLNDLPSLVWKAESSIIYWNLLFPSIFPYRMSFCNSPNSAFIWLLNSFVSLWKNTQIFTFFWVIRTH